MWATVTTAGSKTSTRRVTIDCSASTISAATGTGSAALCGIEACPPRPRTVIRHWSAAAIIGARPDVDAAAGQVRDDVHRERAADRRLRDDVEQPLLEHVAGAVQALLPRLQHEHDLPGQQVAPLGEQPGGAEQHRHVGVVPAGVHGAGDLGGEGQAGVLVHLQGVHVGAQQVGRSRPRPAEDADDRADRRPGGHLDRQLGEGVEHRGLGLRQLQPDLGVPVQPAAQVDRAVGVVVGGGEQVRGADRHAPTLPHASAARSLSRRPRRGGRRPAARRAPAPAPRRRGRPAARRRRRPPRVRRAARAAPPRARRARPAPVHSRASGRPRSTQPDAARCTSCAGAAAGLGGPQVALEDPRAGVPGRLVVLQPGAGPQHRDVAGAPSPRRPPTRAAAPRPARSRRRRRPGARAARTAPRARAGPRPGAAAGRANRRRARAPPAARPRSRGDPVGGRRRRRSGSAPGHRAARRRGGRSAASRRRPSAQPPTTSERKCTPSHIRVSPTSSTRATPDGDSHTRRAPRGEQRPGEDQRRRPPGWPPRTNARSGSSACPTGRRPRRSRGGPARRSPSAGWSADRRARPPSAPRPRAAPGRRRDQPARGPAGRRGRAGTAQPRARSAPPAASPAPAARSSPA